jgi:drug/metabolite transporter (DMT)-like permease
LIKKNIDLIAIVALCSAMLIWASSFIVFKLALNSNGPMTVMFFRMLIGSICFLYFVKQFLKLEFTKDDIKYIVLMAAFEPCLYFVFEANALRYTSASQAGMMASMAPLITAFGAGIILKEVITRKLILGSILAVFGVVWLSVSASAMENATNPMLGNFLEFLAMTFGAGYTIAVRHLSAKFSPIFLTAIQSFIGTIFFLPFALWEQQTSEIILTNEAIFLVAYLGIVVTVGGYGLFNYALGRVEAGRASAYINLIPVLVLLLAFLILGETLSFIELVASGVILTGVFISQMPTEKLQQARARRKARQTARKHP